MSKKNMALQLIELRCHCCDADLGDHAFCLDCGSPRKKLISKRLKKSNANASGPLDTVPFQHRGFVFLSILSGFTLFLSGLFQEQQSQNFGPLLLVFGVFLILQGFWVKKKLEVKMLSQGNRSNVVCFSTRIRL